MLKLCAITLHDSQHPALQSPTRAGWPSEETQDKDSRECLDNQDEQGPGVAGDIAVVGLLTPTRDSAWMLDRLTPEGSGDCLAVSHTSRRP